MWFSPCVASEENDVTARATIRPKNWEKSSASTSYRSQTWFSLCDLMLLYLDGNALEKKMGHDVHCNHIQRSKGMQDQASDVADTGNPSMLNVHRPKPIDVAATQCAIGQRSNSSTPKERMPVLKRVQKMNAQHAANGGTAAPRAGLLSQRSDTTTCKACIPC
jgi:hypothetical protein